MGFKTNHIQTDGSINIDGSIFQYNVEFTGGGGGGGTGDVAWASGNVGSNNQIITANGDGSIVAESQLTFLSSGASDKLTFGNGFFIDDDSGKGTVEFQKGGNIYLNAQGSVLLHADQEDVSIYANLDINLYALEDIKIYSDIGSIKLDAPDGPITLSTPNNDVSIIAGNNGIFATPNILVYSAAGALSEKINAEDLYYYGSTAPGDDHGFASYSKTFGTADYHYMYYRESNDYGGLFHRQGNSYSDLRQDYNYLDFYIGSISGNTQNKVFSFTTSGLEFDSSIAKVIKMSDTASPDSTPQTLSILGAKGKGAQQSGYVTYYNVTTTSPSTQGNTYSTTTGTGFGGGDVAIQGGAGADGSPNPGTYGYTYYQMDGGVGGDLLLSGGAGGTGVENSPFRSPVAGAQGNVTIDGTVINLNSATNGYVYMPYRLGHTGDGDTYMEYTDNVIKFHAGSATYEKLTVSTAGVVVNEDHQPTYDFRVESDINQWALFVDSASDLVIMGAGVPEPNIMPGTRLQLEDSAPYLTFSQASAQYSGLQWIDNTAPTGENARFTWYSYANQNQFDWFIKASGAGSERNAMRLTGTSTTSDLLVIDDVIAFSSTLSDERLKEDVNSLEGSLDKILQFDGVSYKRKDKEGIHYGYIAQDVEPFIPELIKETIKLDGDPSILYKSIRYVEIIPIITEAMKEQQVIIDNQQKEIDDLKEKVEFLMTKL